MYKFFNKCNHEPHSPSLTLYFITLLPLVPLGPAKLLVGHFRSLGLRFAGGNFVVLLVDQFVYEKKVLGLHSAYKQIKKNNNKIK